MLLPLSQDDARELDAAIGGGSGATAAVTTRHGTGGPPPPLSSVAASSSRPSKKSRRFARGQGGGPGAQVYRTCSAFPEYFARILDYRQMDLDATFYQMVTLCVEPAKVYKSAYYRKQTKNRWARDDPAFAVIQLLFLLVATVAWAVAFHVTRIGAFLSLLFHAVIVEWLGFGLVIATLCWWIANHHLRMRGTQGIGDTFFVEQRVEWQYAFDIHCNAFFVMFLFLYVLQFLLAPVMASESFFVLVLANALYSLGWGLYVYITFLGYMALPFLHRTERLLSPMVLIIALFLSTLLLKILFGAAFNLSHMSMRYYYSS